MVLNDVSVRKEEFCRKMDRLLNIPAGSVRKNQELKSLKNWDSLTILEFIVMADTDYGIDLQPAAISACETVDDLAQLTLEHSTLDKA